MIIYDSGLTRTQSDVSEALEKKEKKKKTFEKWT